MPEHQQQQGTKPLKRDFAAMALLRDEESCRTENDFRRLADMYDKLEYITLSRKIPLDIYAVLWYNTIES